ncbi:MAG: twin-arginine translocation signal domain-containing protein, partial [Acidimicrobiaceae bacterium]|nr:twin-arginine translocation signal domain-containing protein [Acidimicrobiaceae bacterium]
MRKLDEFAQRSVSRRSVLKGGATLGAAGVLAAQLEQLAWVPNRVALAATTTKSDIQFDIGAFVHPAQTVAGVLFDFGVLYTQFTTARLTRTPTVNDQTTLANALNTIEANYPFSPSGVFVFTSYGLPYFNRLN